MKENYTLLTLTPGFIIALLLKEHVGWTGFYITLLFIPWIIADIIAGLVFRLLVVPQDGLFTGFLEIPQLFLPSGISVLTDNRPYTLVWRFPISPIPCAHFSCYRFCLRALPFFTLLILAALQTVP